MIYAGACQPGGRFHADRLHVEEGHGGLRHVLVGRGGVELQVLVLVPVHLVGGPQSETEVLRDIAYASNIKGALGM